VNWHTLLAALSALTCLALGAMDAAHGDSGSAPPPDTVFAARDYEDPRIRKLAGLLVDYSVHLKAGERVMIKLTNESAVPLAKEVIDEVYRVGGIPYIEMEDERLTRALLRGGTAERYKLMFSWDSLKLSLMDARLSLDGTINNSELSDVPLERLNLATKYHDEPLWTQLIAHRIRWCYVRIPDAGMAQSAGMSTEAFADFCYKVCALDYRRLATAMEPLAELMAKTDRVRVVGAGTDLVFSIKGIPSVKCDGHINVPDGELFTAPVRNSVNGYVTVEGPSVWDGVSYQDIRLQFRNGKIVKASANNSDRLNAVLNTDEGARFLGEFSLGLNPYIERPTGDALFDEKIATSFHLAIGECYPETDNGNRSALHWDLVCIQGPEYGGGEIWFDGKLVRKDGLFMLPELKGLNPANLR